MVLTLIITVPSNKQVKQETSGGVELLRTRPPRPTVSRGRPAAARPGTPSWGGRRAS